jgi:hypothetical protein
LIDLLVNFQINSRPSYSKHCSEALLKVKKLNVKSKKGQTDDLPQTMSIEIWIEVLKFSVKRCD